LKGSRLNIDSPLRIAPICEHNRPTAALRGITSIHNAPAQRATPTAPGLTR